MASANIADDAGKAKPAGANRLVALDVMRGATIVGMILVNNPGDWGSLYWPVAHAAWHGWTPTDLIFPFFLFMVGVSMAYSFRKYTTGDQKFNRALGYRIVRRVIALLLLGLLLNASGRIFNFALGNSAEWNLDTLRWPGVLQRIAVCYGVASIIVLTMNRTWQLVLMLVILVGYWITLASLPAGVLAAERLDRDSNVVRQVDIALIGKQHMWTRATSQPTDPEGLLSTLPAIVTVLLGYRVGQSLAGRSITAKQCLGLILIGSILFLAAWALSLENPTGVSMPINKALWTSTFVLLTAGLGMITLANCLLLFDVWGKQNKTCSRVAIAFQMVGVNAIFVFVASGLVARLMTILKVGDLTLKNWIYQNGIIPACSTVGLQDPRSTSLVYAISFVAAWWLILLVMWRRGWSIRV